MRDFLKSFIENKNVKRFIENKNVQRFFYILIFYIISNDSQLLEFLNHPNLETFNNFIRLSTKQLLLIGIIVCSFLFLVLREIIFLFLKFITNLLIQIYKKFNQSKK